MKKRVLGAMLCILMLLTLLPVTALAEETEAKYVELTETNFPDENFLAYLQDVYKGQINNNRISVSTVSAIDCKRKGIKDLTGIQLFTELQILNCEDNQLTKLDVSKNKKLRIFDCAGNQLTELDVKENTALTHLTCTDNYLTELDVSKNTALEYLFCNENRLTSLDVSANKALKELACSDNQLTGLDISNNRKLTQLKTGDNTELKELDISQNTELVRLWCDKNGLTKLDVSANIKLEELRCYNNALTELLLGSNIALNTLKCSANQLSALDVSKNTNLTELNCGNNKLTELDVSQNTALTELDCYYNQLSVLDVSKNTNLTELNCVNNQLTTLSVGENTALTELNCAGNKLTKVDTSQCPNLTELDCTAMTAGTLTVNVADRSKLLLSTLGMDAEKVTVQVKNEEQTGLTFGGSLDSYAHTELWLYEGEDPAANATPLCGTCLYTRYGTYRFDAAPITDGTYTLKVKERWSDAVYYTITVSGGVVSGQPNKEESGGSSEIEAGDLNGSGGEANIGDVQCLYTYLTSGVIVGLYAEDKNAFEAAADVNEDGEVDVYDLQSLYEQVAGIR